MTLKIAVLAPMPMASARIATKLKPGERNEQASAVAEILKHCTHRDYSFERGAGCVPQTDESMTICRWLRRPTLPGGGR